ncbi:MAG: hypothetical protein R3C68_02950 [Myxococcota bacterium]
MPTALLRGFPRRITAADHTHSHGLVGGYPVAAGSSDDGLGPALGGLLRLVFPEPGGVVNIGLTIPENAFHADHLKPLFEDILERYFANRMRGAHQRGRLMGHPAVISTRVGPMAERYGLWTGEAARLVMPATVEGIGFALQNGIDAADTAACAFDVKKGFSRRSREVYRLKTASKVLPKFWAGAALVETLRSPIPVDY